jgi:TetR/AcrR family transcriptional regulator
MTKKQRARGEEAKNFKRKNIIATAERLIGSLSGDLPTLEEIAQSVGLVKSAIYLYFPTKEQLYMEVLATGYERWIEQFSPSLNSTNPSLTEFANQYSSFCADNPKIMYLCGIQTNILENRISYKATMEFKTKVAGAIQILGLKTQSAFGIPARRAEELHLQTWALAVGLWGHCHPPMVVSKIYKLPQTSRLKLDYRATLNSAICALWMGTIKEGK